MKAIAAVVRSLAISGWRRLSAAADRLMVRLLDMVEGVEVDTAMIAFGMRVAPKGLDRGSDWCHAAMVWRLIV
jgi:hypothetical protein